MLDKFHQKVNFKILTTMLVLFALAGIAMSMVTMLNLKNIYEENFTERVLLSNNIMASFINGDEVKHYVEMMRGKDEGFKSRQVQFFHNRKKLLSLQKENAPQEEQDEIIARIEEFSRELNELKTESYWEELENFKNLKEISRSKYVYLFADTGVVTDDGVRLYTFIFDSEDEGSYSTLDSDGLGTVYESDDAVAEMIATKKLMDTVVYFKGEPYGECYFAYAPVLDSNGDIVAILGTDIDLVEMNREISVSMVRFDMILVVFFVIIASFIYFFLRRSITLPLAGLTGTAQQLAGGDIYATVPASALKQHNELGVLAHAIKEMADFYQRMDVNRAVLNSNPFTCIIFDEDHNVIDCNPKALEFYRYDSAEEFNKNYRYILESAIPMYQPDGRRSIPINDRIATAFREGYCNFDTYMNLFGKLTPFNTIMKLIRYKGKPAVVVYQFDLTSQKQIQLELEYSGRLLQAVSGISDLLLTSKTENIDTALYEAFDIIGRASLVDRVYLWKNVTSEDGNLFTTRIQEWATENAKSLADGGVPEILLYDADIPYWKEVLSKGKSLNGLAINLGAVESKMLLQHNVVSALVVPIFIQTKFWGFIGFDDCQRERVFSNTEDSILRTCGYMTMAYSDTIQSEISQTLIATKEEALMTARMKSNFLANMSHEIRTPMNAILGMAELVLHEKTTDTVRQYAADIKSACKGLLALINDILDISKIESGKLEIVPSRYQTSSMLMDVISIIKMRADKKNLPFIVNIDAGIPCEMIGDDVRVKQILINLLNNAIKFTHEGNVELSVNGKVSEGRFIIKCSVIDTGIGIKQEDMEKLFESFQQVDTRRNRNIEGTGLGLSISKQLVEMMGGYIEAKSEHGKGSTFTVFIQQDIANSQPMAAIKDSRKKSVLVYENRRTYLDSVTNALDSLGCHYNICTNQSGLYEMLKKHSYDYIFVSSLYANKTQKLIFERKPDTIIVALNGDGGSQLENGILSISMPIHCLQIANILNDEYGNLQNRLDDMMDTVNMTAPDAKVLVVDDNIVNLKVAAGLLKTYGIQADIASSGSRAIEMVKEKAYDLIFMDHMMPEMDGIDTTVAIRKIGGQYFENIPIIALTANAISGAREMFKAEGLDDYLAKPIETSKLNAILAKWLPKKKQRLEMAEAAGAGIADLKISGINTQNGIMYSGGGLEDYLDILSAYLLEGEKRLLAISDCYKEKDFKMLSTYMHTLKSASASIGADDVSHIAANLEFACKNGDTSYIDKNIKLFTRALSTILSNIRYYLNSNEKNPATRSKTADHYFLKENLSKIGTNLENVDIEATEAVLDELYMYNWDDRIFSLLDKFKICIRVYNYDDAKGVLAELKHVVMP